MLRLIFLVAAFTSISFVTGCGQSGPLYLPGDPSEVRQALPAADEEAENEEEADESS